MIMGFYSGEEYKEGKGEFSKEGGGFMLESHSLSVRIVNPSVKHSVANANEVSRV